MDEPPHPIEFVPPDPERIRAFARLVCEQLAERTENACFTQPEAIQGLSVLLGLSARTQARLLNGEGSIDKNEK